MKKTTLTVLLFPLFVFWPFVAISSESQLSNCLPETIDHLKAFHFPVDQQETARQYRNTQVAGYNATEFNTTVTVYVYDKEPALDLKQEFQASGLAVLSAHNDVESPMSGPSRLTISGKPIDGLLGVFLWSERETDFGSFLWIGDVSGKYIKLRTTYIRPEADNETATAMRFAMTAMQRVASHICLSNKSRSDDIGETP